MCGSRAPLNHRFPHIFHMSDPARTLTEQGGCPFFHRPYYYWYEKKRYSRSCEGVDT